MSVLSVNFSTNTFIDTSGYTQPGDREKLKGLQKLITKYLPKLDASGIVSLKFSAAHLDVQSPQASFSITQLDHLEALAQALQALAPGHSLLLEYGVHNIPDQRGRFDWISAGCQLAYNLYPDRLKESVLPYKDAVSTEAVAENLHLDPDAGADPQHVLEKMVNPSLRPVLMGYQELRQHGHQTSWCEGSTFSNTLAFVRQQDSDFARLLETSLSGVCNIQTKTYNISQFHITFSGPIPHISFDLRSCQKVITDPSGYVSIETSTNIPLHLNASHLGAPCLLNLKGAILILDIDERADRKFYATLFQKEHPLTLEPQWFCSDSNTVKPISIKEVIALLPKSIHLYYEDPSAMTQVTSAEIAFHQDDLVKRSTELKKDLEVLFKQRLELEEPQSWLESLSDAFNGGIVEIENAHAQHTLLEIHKKFFPSEDKPVISSTKELILLQKRLISHITKELQIIEKQLRDRQQTYASLHRRLESENQGSGFLGRMGRALNHFKFNPIDALSKILNPQGNPDNFA